MLSFIVKMIIFGSLFDGPIYCFLEFCIKSWNGSNHLQRDFMAKKDAAQKYFESI